MIFLVYCFAGDFLGLALATSQLYPLYQPLTLFGSRATE
jgi:hypothetical protein